MRKAMVVSKIHRLVVRGSLAHMNIQIAEALLNGDKTLASANSKSLVSFGWKAPSGNIPAAYLTGYLLGKKALAAGLDKAILDVGLTSTTTGARLFAALKGVVDAGLVVPHGEDVLPLDQRIKGEHIAQYAAKIRELDSAMYDRRFSQYLSKGLRPEDLPEHFSGIKAAIDQAFKEGS
jgi:large subunit ribosomal protein L18